MTIAPWILSSDKTTLSQFQGDKSAWPIYLTIRNIDKAMQCKPSVHATILIRYIPVTKLTCFTKPPQSVAGYRLFHECMQQLLVPLADAICNGVDMVCTDGFICHVYPILTAYVADHPEQGLVSCCQENFCSKCCVKPNCQGEPVDSMFQDPIVMDIRYFSIFLIFSFPLFAR